MRERIRRFYNLTGWLAMLTGLFGQKAQRLHREGALPTHTPLFAVWLIIVTLSMGTMTCLPALALGPIAEHLLNFGSPQ